MNKKNIIIATLAAALLICAGLSFYTRDYNQIMAVTGATPLALAKPVPSGVSLAVTGMVKREYKFSGSALRALSSTRIRTREVMPDGAFEGTYIYNGIPVYNILEGVAPEKPKSAAFDKPLDMLVTFISSSGKKTYFSYCELTMTDDRHPVTLAYDRVQLLPSKDPEKYMKNRHTGNITGLRLICPKDPDTSRYLDDVTTITLSVPASPDKLLPVMKKGGKCSAQSIVCVKDRGPSPARYGGVEKQSVKNWVRVGHGRGYKGISSAAGYNLRSFLKINFPGCGADDYFLFVACDGYRSLFSGREIFLTGDGASFMLLTEIDGGKLKEGRMLAPVDDYFVDRDVWGLSHIALIKIK